MTTGKFVEGASGNAQAGASRGLYNGWFDSRDGSIIAAGVGNAYCFCRNLTTVNNSNSTASSIKPY